MNKRGRLSRITALGLALLGLAGLWGCYEINPGDRRNSNNYSSKSSESQLEDGARAYGSELNGLLAHRNGKMEYSDSLSAAVSDIPGVAQGFVVLTESNAYAAVMTDHTATGTSGGKANRYEVDNTGTQEGAYDGKGYYHDTNMRYRGHPDRIAGEKNSWTTVQNHEDLSHPFKQTIALKIRELHPGVKDVFISANRDFVNQMNLYAQEHWMGASLDKHVQSFNAICDQIFAYPNVERHAND